MCKYEKKKKFVFGLASLRCEDAKKKQCQLALGALHCIDDACCMVTSKHSSGFFIWNPEYEKKIYYRTKSTEN